MQGEIYMKKIYEFIKIEIVCEDDINVLAVSDALDNYIGDEWDETKSIG